MITPQQITSAGTILKCHGIKGELNAVLSLDTSYFEEGTAVIFDIDGIFVPFFIQSVRSKGATSMLLNLIDVDTEEDARQFVGKTIYIDKHDYRSFINDNQGGDYGTEGSYADDLIGYRIIDETIGEIGEVIDLETSTDNALFIVSRSDAPQSIAYIPIADELITSVDDSARIIEMNLPDGLIDLNS